MITKTKGMGKRLITLGDAATSAPAAPSTGFDPGSLVATIVGDVFNAGANVLTNLSAAKATQAAANLAAAQTQQYNLETGADIALSKATTENQAIQTFVKVGAVVLVVAVGAYLLKTIKKD